MGHQIAYLAPTTYGYGRNNGFQYHDRLFQYYLRAILQQNAVTVGEAFQSAQTHYNIMRTGPWWENLDTYIRYGSALYGLPTQCFVGRCESVGRAG